MTETDDIVARLRKRLGGVQIDAMQGDNLAITLCSSFDDPDEEVDDETCWGASAISGCTATLDAIHEHYAGAIARLEERCAAYKGQVEAGAAEIERLTKEATPPGIITRSVEMHHRAEAAERENAALKEEVDRLRRALEKVSDWIRYELPIPTYAATTMLGVALTALQPQEPKP